MAFPPNISDHIMHTSKEAGVSPEDAVEILAGEIVAAAQSEFGDQYSYQVFITKDGFVGLFQTLTVVDVVADEFKEVSLKNVRHTLPAAEVGQVVRNELTYNALNTSFGALAPGQVKLGAMSITKASPTRIFPVNTNS